MLLAQCHCSRNRVCVARPRSRLGSERPSIFFKTNVTDALNQTKEEVGISRNLNVFPRAERQEAAKQALAFGDEETRSRILQRSERPLTWRAFLPFRLFKSPEVCAGTGRNVLSCALVRMQRRRKLRTWTSTRLDGFGFHQDPQQGGVECLGISGRRS